MITVANRMHVNSQYAEQFEQRFRDRAGLVDQMPGFLSNYVLRPTQPGEPYVVLTLWESREAFEAWTQSDAFKQGHARSGSLPRDAFDGPNALEVHEVVVTSDAPPQSQGPS